MAADVEYSGIVGLDVLSFELDSSKDKTDAFRAANCVLAARDKRSSADVGSSVKPKR